MERETWVSFSTLVWLRILNTVKRSGYELLYQLLVANKGMFLLQIFLSASSAVLYYAPAWFLQQLVHFLEMTRGEKPLSVDKAWGWVYCGGLLLSTCLVYCKNYLILYSFVSR